MIYTLAQIRNGTGFPKGQKFMTLEQAQELITALRDLIEAAVPFGIRDDDPIQLAKDNARQVLGDIAWAAHERECREAAEALLREKKRK